MTLYIFLLIVLFELFFYLIFINIKKKFPWIINSKDLYPKFNKERFKNFKIKRYDAFLGWDNKPKSKSFDLSNGKKIKYEINNKGQRKTLNPNKKTLFASFGDSYVFCRQIEDNNTWQEIIAKKNKYKIANYGVGNYGFDQSILKYSRINLDKNTKFVIQGFVPETISRIQSQWKHFLEFGNLHGFKPMFYLSENNLKLKKNPLNNKVKIQNIHKIIKKIKTSDRFYKDKFKKYIIQFPYIYYFFLNFNFNLDLLYNYLSCSLLNFLRKKKINIHETLFALIVKRNLIMSHFLYKENYSKVLFSKLIDKFILVAKRRNHVPILIVFPQLIDLKLDKTNYFYMNFFKSLENKLKVIDLTYDFKKKKLKKMFINDKYGGHLSMFGNKFTAQIINKKLKKIIKERNEKNL